MVKMYKKLGIILALATCISSAAPVFAVERDILDLDFAVCGDDISENMKNIRYYNCNVGAQAEYGSMSFVKIMSADEWEKSGIDITYDSSFWLENFLLIVNWIEPASFRSQAVSAIEDEESSNTVTIDFSELDKDEVGADVLTPYCAVISLPKEYSEREYVAERSRTVFNNGSLFLYDAPTDGRIYYTDDTGKRSITISGRYIEPAPEPIKGINLFLEGVNAYIETETALTGKKLVAAAYAGDIMTDMQIFDVNMESGSELFELNEDMLYNDVRLMLLDSFENMTPVCESFIGFAAPTGGVFPPVSVLISKKDGGETSLDTPDILENGWFSLEYELEPGEYKLKVISSYGSYICQFTVTEDSLTDMEFREDSLIAGIKEDSSVTQDHGEFYYEYLRERLPYMDIKSCSLLMDKVYTDSDTGEQYRIYIITLNNAGRYNVLESIAMLNGLDIVVYAETDGIEYIE